jgi:hypothetical protein
LVATFFLTAATAGPTRVAAEGALAVGTAGSGKSAAQNFGVSTNEPTTDAARSKSLTVCRTSPPPATVIAEVRAAQAQCAVVDTFRDKCVAVARDKAGSLSIGWAVADTQKAADDEALIRCRSAVGPERWAFCKVLKQVCDGSISGASATQKVIETPPPVGQNLTPEVWKPYTDAYGLIHDKRVTKENPIPTGNALLYTSEACVIMELRKVNYETIRKKISEGVEGSQVKPGLFGRGPTKKTDQNDHDDYVGLGALAGICGFRDVARDILNYGRGREQPSGPTVLGSSGVNFGAISDKLKHCNTVPYNYNNVHPGKVKDSWMGKYPDLITHLKIAAGERPTSDELAYWGAAIIFSAKQEKIRIPKEDKMGSWLLAWLQVLTYQLSRYHSAAADYASVEWWKELRSQFPEGGIKQVMKQYLNADAEGNPLGDFIDNFEQSRNPDVVMVDNTSDPETLLRPLLGILTNDCGPKSLSVCIDYRNFSPTNLSAQFDRLGVVTEMGISAIQAEIARQQKLLDAPPMLKWERENFEKMNKTLADAETEHRQVQQQIDNAISRLNEIITKVPQPRGMCFRSPCNNVFLCPPSTVPCAVFDNVTYKQIVDQITRAQNTLQEHTTAIKHLRPVVERARQALAEKNREFDVLNGKVKVELDRLQGELTKAKGFAEATRGLGLAITQGSILIPCTEVSLDPSSVLTPAIEILPPPVKN